MAVRMWYIRFRLAATLLYVGQTGRCVNLRLIEHRRSLTGRSPSELSLHCRQCKCTPKFDECSVLYWHRNEEIRLMIEAWHIDNSGSACMSQPSIKLHIEEIKCLSSYLLRRSPRVSD
uniref:Tick transposon n=1 Tax=Rhipicephalus pulchellus TaxID=72859 RepID=L7LW57_RHIPC